MVIISCPYKTVIGRIEQITNASYLRRYYVNVLLRRNACAFCDIFNLLSVLVRAGQKEYVITLKSFVSCNCIRQNYFITVADVRLA